MNRRNSKIIRARRDFKRQILLHPELTQFIENPRNFQTDIEQISGANRIANSLHLRDATPYYPTNRRKLITCDTQIAELLNEGYRLAIPSFLGAGGPREFLAFDPQQVNVGIVVAGGSAPGTNTIIHWITHRHLRCYGMTSGNVLGFIGGFRGLGRKGEVNIKTLSVEETQAHLTEPGCIIGMSRHREDYRLMVDTLQELEIDILYVVGGDGTLEAAHLLAEEIKRRSLHKVIAAIPKTIDDDIAWCWKTFGFETAIDEATRQIHGFHSNVRTHGRIGLFVLYGGFSGFLAANAGLSSGVTEAVLIPEEQISLPSLLAYTQRCLARKKPELEDHALYVIAEGIGWQAPFWKLINDELIRRGELKKRLPKIPADGATEAMRNAFITVLYQLFKNHFTGSRHTPVIAEPRSLVSATPPSARDIRYCQRLAYNAVDNALAGFTDFMSSYWLTEYVLVPLNLVAGVPKKVPTNGAFWSNVRSTTGQPLWQ